MNSKCHFPPSAIEALNNTHPGLEIWFDSSPLIFDTWCQEVLSKIEDEAERALRYVQLGRLYKKHAPAESVFVGVTTNPPLSKQAIDRDQVHWAAYIELLAQQELPTLAPLLATGKALPFKAVEDLFWKVYTDVVGRGAAWFRPIFEASGYTRGYLSGQVDPRILQDTDAMVKQGMALNSAHRNVMIKMPGTQEGIEGIRILTSKGIPTNATLVFTVPQILQVAKAVMAGVKEAEAKGVDLSQWRSVCTMMLGRYEDNPEFKRQAAAKGLELTEQDIRWSGPAIFKKCYHLYRERGYRSKLLAASMRIGPTIDGKTRIWHLEKLAGGNIVLTIFPNVLEAFMNHYTPEEVRPQIDEEVPPEVLEKLLQVDYFAEAYEEDGIAPEDYIKHPAVIATGDEFSKATTALEAYVGERLSAALRVEVEKKK